MRTIKRCSIKLNLGKQEILVAIANAYSKEKQSWLVKFQQQTHIPFIKNHRIIRDQTVNSNYKSCYGLQARHWKLALQDAAETQHKYWHSLFEKVKRDIAKSTLSDIQKYYAFWLLKDYSRLAEIMSFNWPYFKKLPLQERKRVVNYLNRKIRIYKKNYPRVKKARSFVLDDNCYEIFTHEGRQYIKMMTLIPRKRVVIPLSGNTPIQGNIRIVIKDSIVEVHYTATIKTMKPAENDSVIAVDFGYSEVMTDSDGEHYGTEFGEILTNSSDTLKVKMQNRNKLHALQKQYAESDSKEKRIKAKNILKNNLGRIKLDRKQQKLKVTLSREINTAFNKLTKKKIPTVISESLSHMFDYQHGRTWNRRLSAWVKGTLVERLEFKALAKGFSHKQVNPAYTSQTCPSCSYVDHKNRKGDKFQCLHCRYENHADWVAAMNLRSRYFDREITRYTPYREVKRILQTKFQRRLETDLSGTVSARIPDTAIA